MSEERNQQEQSPAEADERPEREANPADNPGPRGNQEADPERVEGSLENIDRAGAN